MDETKCLRCPEPYVDGGDGYQGLCPSCADGAYGQECPNCSAGTLEMNEDRGTLACAGECGVVFGPEASFLTPAEDAQGVSLGQYCCFESYLFKPEGITYIRIHDREGEELVYWDYQEWVDDPQLVMGAIMGAIQNGAERPQAPTKAPLTPEDLGTILAALRHYQAQGMGDPRNRPDDLHDIATNGEVITSLDDGGIDALCERLNSGDLLCPSEES